MAKEVGHETEQMVEEALSIFGPEGRLRAIEDRGPDRIHQRYTEENQKSGKRSTLAAMVSAVIAKISLVLTAYNMLTRGRVLTVKPPCWCLFQDPNVRIQDLQSLGKQSRIHARSEEVSASSALMSRILDEHELVSLHNIVVVAFMAAEQSKFPIMGDTDSAFNKSFVFSSSAYQHSHRTYRFHSRACPEYETWSVS